MDYDRAEMTTEETVPVGQYLVATWRASELVISGVDIETPQTPDKKMTSH